MPFSVLLGLRKPDQGLIQVVEAVGLLLGIESTVDGQGPEVPVYRTVPPGSIYGQTLEAITQHPTSDVLERLRLLDLSSISDEVAHEVFAKTLRAAFAAAGNTCCSPGLAPPWAASPSSAFPGSGSPPGARRSSRAAGSTENAFGGGTGTASTATKVEEAAGATPETRSVWNGAGGAAAAAAARREVDEAVHALKLAVLCATRRLMDETRLLPLQDRTTAVLVDGSRMSLLALELAGAAWKFGRFAVVHVTGEEHPGETDDDEHAEGSRRNSGDGAGDHLECEEAPTTTDRKSEGEGDRRYGPYEDSGRRGAGRRGERRGRWEPSFLEAELRETCLRQLEIPEESLELVFRSLPTGSSGTVDEVTKVIDAILTERGVEMVYMGCYGRRGPRVAQFGAVAQWALEHTRYQIVFAKKFSPSMVAPAFLARPKRYLFAVTSNLEKVSHMLDTILPLVSPRDSLVLVHIVDESVEDMIAGEMVDVEQVNGDLLSLLSHKQGLRHRVRVEKTGRPPEQSTQTVVQRIVKVAEEEAADFLAILYDESRGSYRTVATGCLREARCGLIAIH